MIRRIFWGKQTHILRKGLTGQGNLRALFCSGQLEKPEQHSAFKDLFLLFNKDPKGFGKFNRKKPFQKQQETTAEETNS